MGSFTRIIDYLNIYLDMHQQDTGVMFCLATLYVKDHQYVRANERLHQILLLEPDNTDAKNLQEEVEHILAQNPDRR